MLPQGANAQVQPQLARQWFEEVTKLCERDAGRLWGVSLCGPMVIFDQRTRTRATSQPEPDGPPPRFPGMADGPVSWGGARWFSFPLYMLANTDADIRQQNMLHGLFHRIQPELEWTQASDDGFNEHLDTLEGRVWLQLEWRALRRALESTARDRADAIADALAFRRERRRGSPPRQKTKGARRFAKDWPPTPVLPPGPARLGRRTGQQHQQPREAKRNVVRRKFRSRVRTRLRRAAGRSDAGMASATSCHVGPRRLARLSNAHPPTADVNAAAVRYGGPALRKAEEARDLAQQVRVAELRRRFVDGPVLTMPAPGSGTSDTTGSVVIPGVGTVFFGSFTRTTKWGRLNANNGVLLSGDGSTLSVPVTGPLQGSILEGNGWSVTLNSGWVLQPAARVGSFAIVPEK